MKSMQIPTIPAILLMFFSFSLANAQAGNGTVGGAILGGGTGALVGQAIGHDTKSTLIGAAAGGVMGFIVGTELERHHRIGAPQSSVIAHSERYDKRGYRSRIPRPVFDRHHRYDHFRDFGHHREYHREYRNYPHYRYDRGNCRKIITIRRGHYGTKRIMTIVCDGTPRHRHQNDDRFRFHDRFHR